MVEKALIEKIINESINAPSGSNSQPWEFICSQNTIKIKYLPEKDHPILNYNNRGTLIACGALIENIIITAKHYKLDPLLEIASNFENKIIATITFQEKETLESDDLYEFIKSRTTNRKPYKKYTLSKEEKEYLLKDLNDFNNCRVSVIEDNSMINEISKLLAYDTYLNFNNDNLRRLLFEEIIFDKKIAHQGEKGLYIRTMEFKPPQIFMIKLLKNNKIFKFMKNLGIVKAIYQSTAKMYSATGTLIGFSVINDNKEFINIGRLIENIWLKATKLNLSCHLITGIFFFWQQANFGNKDIFNKEELNIINSSYQRLYELFNLNNNFILTAVMRIGKSDPPSARSIKKPPNIQWET